MLSWLLCLLPIFVYFWFKKNQTRYWEERGVPGPKPLPLFGNMLQQLTKSNTDFFSDGIQNYGKVFGYMEFNKPVLVVGQHELLKDILIKDFNLFSYRRIQISDEMFCLALTYIRGDRWRQLRKLSTPAFSAIKIQSLVPHMREAAATFRSVLTSSMDSEVDLRKTTSAFTIDAIARTAFDVRSQCQTDPNDEFYKHACALTHFNIFRIFLTILLPQFLRKLLGIDMFPNESKDYIKAMMNELYRRELQSNKEGSSLLGMWIRGAKEGRDECSPLTLEEFIAQGATILVGGFETTSNLLTMCFHTLAVQQNVQARLFQEISEQYSEEKMNSGDFSTFTYLDAFLNEVLRKYPPVVYWDREAADDYILGDTGIKIEKGTKIVTPFHAIQNDPDLYPEPDVIRPERFLRENKDLIPKYAFLPFGLGPRNCLGMRFGQIEAKVLLIEVLRHFEVLPCGKTNPRPKSQGVFLTLQYEPLFAKFSKRE